MLKDVGLWPRDGRDSGRLEKAPNSQILLPPLQFVYTLVRFARPILRFVSAAVEKGSIMAVERGPALGLPFELLRRVELGEQQMESVRLASRQLGGRGRGTTCL